MELVGYRKNNYAIIVTESELTEIYRTGLVPESLRDNISVFLIRRRIELPEQEVEKDADQNDSEKVIRTRGRPKRKN